MGHKSIQITLRYAHLAPSNLMDAVKVLSRSSNISPRQEGQSGELVFRELTKKYKDEYFDPVKTEPRFLQPG